MNDIVALEKLRNMGETDLLNLFHSRENLDKANAALAMELDTARQILVDICNVVGACTADVSLSFLAHLPGEVKAQLEKLTTQHQTAVRAAAAALAEKDALLEEVARLQTELARLKGEAS